MKFTDMAAGDSKYLKSSDLQGKDVQVVISSFSEEELEERDGTTKKKWIVHFQAREKGLVLNVTNAATLGDLFVDSESAIGKPVILYTVETKMGPGIRVRGVSAPAVEDVPF